ncbi:putative phage abortive infection protein [Arcticibacter tournemirensis]
MTYLTCFFSQHDSQYWSNVIQGIAAFLTLGGLIYVGIQFSASKKQFAYQKDVNDQQIKASKAQQFDNTFFQILSLHKDAVSKIGRPFFSTAAEELKGLFTERDPDGYGGFTAKSINFKSVEEIAIFFKNSYYDNYYKNYEHICNHYFRNLYHMFRFIHESHLISFQEKLDYVRIARAQLSQKESYVIMCNAMFEGYGYPKMMFLTREFDILQNFRSSEVEPAMLYDYYKYLLLKVKKPKSFKYEYTVVANGKVSWSEEACRELEQKR